MSQTAGDPHLTFEPRIRGFGDCVAAQDLYRDIASVPRIVRPIDDRVAADAEDVGDDKRTLQHRGVGLHGREIRRLATV